jgi:hypothetical protein
MPTPTLRRGMVFRAEHDDTYDFWGDDQPPRSKLCLVFNAEPVSGGGEVHYFLSTSKVAKLRETPSILSDVLILPAGRTTFGQMRRFSIFAICAPLRSPNCSRTV